MERPIVFVGYSSESKELGEAVQNNLSSVAYIQLWTQEGVFTPSSSFLEGLLQECEKASFAILILSRDDMTKSRNAIMASPRDNIIFEAGLFMGALGRKRVFLLVPETAGLKIPSDLSGIMMLEYSAPPQGGTWSGALGRATNIIGSSIKNLGNKPPTTHKPKPPYVPSSNPDAVNMAGRIYEDSDDPDFVALFKKFFVEAGKVIMIGTGFNILHARNPLSQETLYPRIQKNRPLEIYAANPFSPNVETRFIEEETGSTKPTIGKGGLIAWWKSLLAIRRKVEGKSRFSLRFFPFYPTYALFIFDDRDFFFYPYGYTQLGTFSPVMHFSKDIPEDQEMVKFLEEQYKTVKMRSADAELILDLYANPRDELKSDQLPSFAVYLIPPANSQLYTFGSSVLEYDVRTRRELPATAWHDEIGAAFEFGLHVTIADALYCAHERDIDLICEEVSYTAKQFRPFTLNLRLEKNFPNKKGIALVCDDKSGSLEALHFEMVARVYRKALASNYSLGIAPADRDQDQERAELMIEHYHAPYILQRFKPHFSLLSDVKDNEDGAVFEEIKELYQKSVDMSMVSFNKIAVMHKPISSRHWQILNEFDLGGAR